MIILILLSIIAVAIVIERLVFFSNQHGDSKALLRSLGQKIAADDLKDGCVKAAKAAAEYRTQRQKKA